MPVTVQGPDGNNYEFPDGTDKDAAVAYFKKKNITGKKPEKDTGELGTLKDTLSNAWEHAKGLVTGPIRALAPPESPEEATVAGLNVPGSLAAYRMFVEPTVNALTEFADLRAKGGPQASILHGSTWDPATGARTPTAGSKLIDAIPIYGPWAEQSEKETHEKGVAPMIAGLATDVAGGELMGKLPGLGKKFLGATARKGAQTLLGAGPDATRRAVEAENARAAGWKTSGDARNAQREQFVDEANADLKKHFLDRLDVSMKEDRGMLTEHEAKMQNLDEQHRTAQREHQANLRDMHERNLERARQNQLAETERLSRNAEKTGKYRMDVQKVKDDNAAALAEHEAAKRKAQTDWDELNKAHGQGQEAIASRDTMERQVQEDLKTLEKKVNEEANKKYNDLREKMKDTAIPREDAAAAVEEANEWVRGSPDTIKQFKFISDMENGAATLKWNDLQGYLEEFRNKLRAGGMESDLFQAVKSMEAYIEKEMGKLAKEHGTAADWADAQASWRRYKSTFYDNASPVAKAIDARTSDVASRGFMGRKVMTEDPALGNLRTYDPGLYNRIERLREVSGAAKAAPGAPKPLVEMEPPKLKDPEEVPVPKTEDEPIPFDRGFEDPNKLKMPEPKGTARSPRAKPLTTPKGKEYVEPVFEERTVDVPDIKKERARSAARRFSEVKEGDVYLAHTPAAPFVFAKKFIASRLDRPAVLEWLAKPNAGDLEALEALPPEAKARARARIDEYLKAQPAPVRLDPRMKAFIGAGVVTTSAEQRAREAAQRLRERERQQAEGMQLGP